MIACNFDYYLPDTWQEAVDIYKTVQTEGKTPLYYGGGTEIISMARVHNVRPDAVIDVKKIPECRCMGTDGIRLLFGSVLTLGTLFDGGLYPLLSQASARIADHTIQCKLTLGGNLAGTIHYHETLLPLLLADSMVCIASPQGLREAPVINVFGMGKKLPPGDLIINVSLDKAFAALSYAHIKKPKIEKIGYPLVSLAALDMDGTLRLAASGLCPFPFMFEDIPINNGQAAPYIAQQLLHGLPAPILNDLEGTAAYRQFIFEKTAEKIIMEFRNNRRQTDA